MSLRRKPQKAIQTDSFGRRGILGYSELFRLVDFDSMVQVHTPTLPTSLNLGPLRSPIQSMVPRQAPSTSIKKQEVHWLELPCRQG
jgi:hypothetical protein